MMNKNIPAMRRDLQFFPVQHGGKQLILIKDHLGLVQEGKAIELPLYQLMTTFDGSFTIRDMQMTLMRQRGGMLVSSDEVKGLVDHLDDSYLLESERFKSAKKEIEDRFTAAKMRPCTHSGQAYPADPLELKNRLDEILASHQVITRPDGKVTALVVPHIDFAVGPKVYASGYQAIEGLIPSRVVILGVGHQMMGNLFSLTEKDFETPLGVVRNDKNIVQQLKVAGCDVIAENDFAHRNEHSIEFQIIFLQHLLEEFSFTIVPILCGSIQASLPEYTREAYLQKSGPFKEAIKQLVTDPAEETLVLAGVDFSHIGPKFGHDTPAFNLESQTRVHDKALLDSLCNLDGDGYWEESRRVRDQFNVCGFSALACLLEVLPPSTGLMLGYDIWHEEPTRSAVSFASVAFTSV